MILQTLAIGSIFLCRAKSDAIFVIYRSRAFQWLFLLLFLHKNLIDLERLVNLAILQNISIFK